MDVKEFKTEIDKDKRLTFLGDVLFTRNEQGNLKCHIATIFPHSRVIVTEPSTLHGDQCAEYINYINAKREAENASPLSDEQKRDICNRAVSISIIDGGDDRCYAIIRTDSKNMELAFFADEILQQLLPKFRIFFMRTKDDRIRQTLRERGESWRIQTLPQTKEEMQESLDNSKFPMFVFDREIYYYNLQKGVRYLTYETFCNLKDLDCETLRAFLNEIQFSSRKINREGYPDIAFFMASNSFSSANFQRYDFNTLDEPALRSAHEQLCREFESALSKPSYKKDDLDNWEWLVSMFSHITTIDKCSTEEYRMGLCEEFALKITWLPGGKINEDGGLIKDPVYTMKDLMSDSERERLCDPIPRLILYTYVRESFNIEYANIGKLPPIRPHSYNNPSPNDPTPRRGVYVMLVKMKDEEEQRLSIIRLQKWDVREMLDQGRSLVDSSIQAEEYSDYVLNRRLACHLLKMTLPKHLKVRRFVEIYEGKVKELHGMPIHTAYYEREYIPGTVTDLLGKDLFQDPEKGEEFSIRFARMLGEAAAPNLIVGRSDKYLPDKPPIFDDGDEVLQLDADGMPEQIVVSEQPGTFVYYIGSLEDQIDYYALPMFKRSSKIFNFKQAVDAYVNGFLDKFRKIRELAKDYRNTFDELPNKDPGSMFDKWHHVLDRLRDADPDALAEKLYDAIRRKCPEKMQ